MVLKRLKQIFAKPEPGPHLHTAPDPTVDTVLHPGRPFCAIGDIHGRRDLLDPLLAKLRGEFGPDVPVVFIGDAIDRGPDSAGVLSRIQALTGSAPETHIALMGNHEQMMIDFIDDPAGKGARWLSFGGIETLASFGIEVEGKRLDAEDALDTADALESAMPPGMLDWLRALPVVWSTGNVHCVHAAMDPEISPAAQSPRVMVNGHPAFLRRPRSDGQTVVHGHTVMADPVVGDTRISIDTGAVFTGRLTAAYVATDTCRFIS
jgi:serine/threonine protein phosphatase 1